MTIRYTCPQCGEQTKVACAPEVKAQIYGDPMDCYPGEPASIDPDECDYCGCDFDINAVFDELPKPGDHED